ncbi:MAG: hypothetical protein ACJ8C4_03775 [Gemmataceae bacterium]
MAERKAVYRCPKCKTEIPFGTREKPPPSRCPNCHRRLYIPSDYDGPLAHIAEWVFQFALEREAQPFRRLKPNARIVVAGVGPERAAAATRQTIERFQPPAVISCGYAGALCQDLAVGEVVYVAGVIDEQRQGSRCDAIRGTCLLLSVSQIVAEPSDKIRLGEEYSADLVDMESAAIARVCSEANVPFGCIRVVSDSVSQRLSPTIARLLGDGQISVWKTMPAILRNPLVIAELLRLARDTKIASLKLGEALARL